MKQHSVIAAAVLFLLALCTIILYPAEHYAVVYSPRQTGFESMGLASSLVEGHGFADPYVEMPTGPSALVPPVFPAFLAFILSHSSSDAEAYFVMRWCATLMVALQLCLLPLLAQRLGLGFYAGAAAAVLWLVARVPRPVFWEQSYSGVLITVLAFLMYDALRERMTLPRTVLCGVLWGVLILLCPVALPVLVAWLALVYFVRTQTSSRVLVLALLPALLVTPWLVRNYQTFHQFVFVRDGLGLELEVGNNSCASFSFDVNRITRCYAQHHPNENRALTSQVASLGEVGFNRQRLLVAEEWIRSHPGDFVRLTLQRVAAFWMPSLLSSEESVIHDPKLYSPLRDAIVTLASLAMLAGLLLLWRRNRSACMMLLLWLLAFPPIYYFVAYQERYRIPVQWVPLLLAGYAASELVRKLRKDYSGPAQR